MSNNSVNFKFGSTIEGKSVETNDLVVINEGLAEGGNDKFGSVYKGDKMVGTTKADSLYTTGDITIAGGPMETILKAVYGEKIPAGTSMQELFMALACEEKWPSATYSRSDVTSKFADLSAISVKNANNSAVSSGSLQEVGTPLTVAAFYGSDASFTAPKITYSGFTYGHTTSPSNTGTKPATIANPDTVTGTVTKSETVKVSLTRTRKGFTQSTDADTDTVKQGMAGNTQGSTLNYPQEVVIVEKGENSLQFTMSADSDMYSATIVAPTLYYALSNLYNTDKNGVSQKVVHNDLMTARTSTSTPANKSCKNAFTITGVYPIYANGIKAKISADNKDTGSTAISTPVTGDDGKMDLMLTGTAFAVSFAGQKGDGLEPYRLYVPQGTTIKSAHAIHPTIGDYSVDCKSKFVKNGTKTFTVQNVECTYDVFEWAGTEGPNRVKFVLQ